MALRIEALTPLHDGESFFCGQPELDDYFRRRAGQDERRNIARVFVAIDDRNGVVGFYTLSTCSIDCGELPQQIARKLPRYGDIPAALIGRLARDVRVRGQGVGEILIGDAIKRVLQADRAMAVWAIIVDAKDDRAVEFYAALGFTPFPSRPRRLFLTTVTARSALARA